MSRGKDAANHAADSRAHQAAARRALRRRLLLRGPVTALRSGRTDPAKGRRGDGDESSLARREVLAKIEFKHDPLDQALRAAALELGVKAGQMFQPIRWQSAGARMPRRCLRRSRCW